MNYIPEEQYKFILENLPISCVDLVLKNQKGEFLLVKRKTEPAKDLWWLPGGRVLKKETIKQAALRLAKQEVGLEVEFIRILGVDETIFDKGPFNIKTGTHSINTFVEAKMKPGQIPKLDENHEQPTFFKEIDESWPEYVKNAIKKSNETTTTEKRFIPVAEPFITDKEIEYATDAVKSTWISSRGEYIEKFEKKFAEFCQVKHALSCNNGTSAIHLALLALDIKHGDEVILPTLTYIATANCVKYIGAKPVFVDSKEQDWQIDENKIEEKITPNTKAIIAVHLYGIPNNMDKIIEIAKKHNLYVIEDCAEAHGAQYKGKKVGSIGDIGCFSFFGNKIITTGEGGACTTNNDEIAEKIKLIKNQGMSATRRYFHPIIGYNYRMTNIQAAIGLAQTEKIQEILKIRELIAEIYNQNLKNIPDVKFFQKPPQANYNHVYWMYCITSEKIEKIIEKLKQNKIDTRPFFIPVHKMPPYDTGEHFPVAESLSKKGINLPCNPTLSNEDIVRICNVIKEAVNE